MAETQSLILTLIDRHQSTVLDDWLDCMARSSPSGAALRRDGETPEQAKRFLEQLRRSARNDQYADINAADWAPMRELLEEISRARVVQGFTPSETATFVFSLKEPLFQLLRREITSADKLADEIWTATRLLDSLGLYTTECYAKAREELISRQQQELLELSTPVVALWDGILALPLIGTLDSARTQIVMESLLERIVASGAEIAIIDITGVPTVDTLVAQHLIKTISAARLMGADCILSGIRPQIAQTIVHLGLELNVVSKATMADALGLALRRSGKAIQDRAAAKPRQHD
ncbi:MAG TPA: STAS domain-containing protein [Acetobacteraceae bacterium]|nr:STAS domain-containing protein [Acetobacteraceae bacterium]